MLVFAAATMPSDATTTDFPLPRRAGAYTFASLFAVESFVRALNSTVISLQAYDILGAAQKVSMLSTAVSLTVLTSTLMLPVGGIAIALFLGWTPAGALLTDEVGGTGRGREALRWLLRLVVPVAIGAVLVAGIA